FFSIFTNFFMDQQLSGAYDIVKSVTENGGPATVVDVFSKLPIGTVFVVAILITSIISMATNFDSAAYTLAMVSSKKIQLGERPSKSLTIFWALCMAAIPMTLMIFGGSLAELQTLSIILALPTCIVYAIIVWSCFKMLKKYYNEMNKTE
ncbi:MAG: BCCT family transporter, partial [Eubacterium sp.]